MKKNRIVKGLLLTKETSFAPLKAERIEFEDTLQELYRLVNCELVEMPTRYIDHVPYTFIIDEEGQFKSDRVIHGVDNTYMRECIVGHILVVSGYTDNEGNILSLTDKDYERIEKAIDREYDVIVYAFE